MCSKSKCIYPERLKETPERCSLEQIAECHPNMKEHPCARKET
ncbi:MAG: hypothetical protein QXI59_05910 [Candidatus Bathyarchaeia archaeon]